MKLLFIAPKFFNYEKEIINELSSYYCKIIFKTEVPFQSAFSFYAIRRFSKKIAQKALENYNKKLIALIINQDIDRIFIIRGFGLNEEFLSSIKRLNKKIEVFHYQWDSFNIVPNGQTIAKYSDFNYSFDKCDVAKNPLFTHLPLFSLLKKSYIKSSLVNDILFIGTYHSDRINISNRVEEYCKLNNLLYSKYLYMPFYSFIRNRFQGNYIKYSDVKFRKMSYKKYQKAMLNSKVIVDSPYKTQCGATMRTIETLSLDKKLITTNKNIFSEKFYSDKNILVLDESNIIKIDNLISCDFDHSKDDEILDLKSWLYKIKLI
jgi:hypothetical protein